MEILSSIDSIIASLATIAVVVFGYLYKKLDNEERKKKKENDEAQ
jgi:hypothetical protein